MKKNIGNMKKLSVLSSPDIWAEWLGKFPSSSLYLCMSRAPSSLCRDLKKLAPFWSNTWEVWGYIWRNMKKYVWRSTKEIWRHEINNYEEIRKKYEEKWRKYEKMWKKYENIREKYEEIWKFEKVRNPWDLEKFWTFPYMSDGTWKNSELFTEVLGIEI